MEKPNPMATTTIVTHYPFPRCYKRAGEAPALHESSDDWYEERPDGRVLILESRAA